MARAHEDDLRRKFLGAYDRGEGTLEQLAGVFGVSLGWTKKISSQCKRTFQVERVRHQPGSQVAGWLRSAKTGGPPGRVAAGFNLSRDPSKVMERSWNPYHPGPGLVSTV
jgi:hypothetical protein